MNKLCRDDILEKLCMIEDEGKDILDFQSKEEIKSIRKLIINDFFQIVICGEFKRGKTTFINALIQKAILPMDILPETATINVLLYSETPQLQVVFHDGTHLALDFSVNNLKQFSVKGDKEYLKKIAYVKIGYPLEMLRNRVAIVDTPGVADLDETRNEITYSYIPNANVVIFVLDANEPFTKTEKDFIVDKVLPLGVRDILFLINKFDDVDEDDEVSYINKIEKRLRRAFKMGTSDALLDTIHLLPVSSLLALDGFTNKDSSLIDESNIVCVRDKIREIISKSNREQNKLRHYHDLYKILVKRLISRLEKKEAINHMSYEELRNAREHLQKSLEMSHEKEKEIDKYVEDCKRIILMLSNKSIHTFTVKLLQSLLDDVDYFQGKEFKEFVEKRLVKKVEKNIDSWVSIYIPYINVTLKQIEKSLSYGLSRSFNTEIYIQTRRVNSSFTNNSALKITAEDVSNTIYQAGAIAAVGGIGLMTIVGSSVMPFISLAALPYLKDYMMKEKLKEAKSVLLPELKKQILSLEESLDREVEKYVTAQCKAIDSNAKSAYVELIKDIEKDIQEKLSENQKKGSDISIVSSDISKFKSLLNTAIESE